MEKLYQVKFRVWQIGDYLLKRGDVVTITHIGNGWCEVNNTYFIKPIPATYDDLKAHCKELN